MDEPPEPDDIELAKVPLAPDILCAPDGEHDMEALLRHIQALRNDIARYSQQIVEIEAGCGDAGAAPMLRSALKQRALHLALMEVRLAESS